MRIIIQRVSRASVKVENEIVGAINCGYLLLVGISISDDLSVIERMAKKVYDLRINDDSDGKMNLGITDVGGKILSVSQFTLYADCKKGKRPSFDKAAVPDIARNLYYEFNQALKKLGLEVECGIFQAEMQVEIINEGPITIILDSDTI